jgi:hypothetical protein
VSIQSRKVMSDGPSGRSKCWCTDIVILQNPPYKASRHLLIPRIAASGTSFSPLPCQAWHGCSARLQSPHRVEVELGADGAASAHTSGAAATTPPAGAHNYFSKSPMYMAFPGSCGSRESHSRPCEPPTVPSLARLRGFPRPPHGGEGMPTGMRAHPLSTSIPLSSAYVQGSYLSS